MLALFIRGKIRRVTPCYPERRSCINCIDLINCITDVVFFTPCLWQQLTKISRISMLVKRGSSGSGSAGDEKYRDDSAGVRPMMVASPPPREFKKNEKAKPKVGGGGSGAAELC